MESLLAQSGGGNTNYVQIIIWGILISISVLSWLIKLLAQKREEAKIRAAKRAREEDMLRTGRTAEGTPMVQASAPVAAAGPASHDDARRRLQEIAQRRRAELEQMSRSTPAAAPVAPQRPAPAAPSRSPVAPSSRPFQPRPIAPAGQPVPRPQAPRAPEPQRTKPAPRQEQRKQKKQPQQPNRPPQRQADSPTLAEKLMQAPTSSSGAYAVAPQPLAPVAPAAPGGVVVGRATRVSIERATTPDAIAALRKALVLSELLAPPLSMRPDADGSSASPLMQRAG